jgi:hypothetical protein
MSIALVGVQLVKDILRLLGGVGWPTREARCRRVLHGTRLLSYERLVSPVGLG